MLKANKTYVALLFIFTFSFCYRILLMLWAGFPPGADIGLHNSVIYSITSHGNVDFFYNFYHIGGGVSLTFPGYHIFTTSVILLTGLPEYVAHATVVALFSSLLVLCAFFITKKVWSTQAAFIVAFLMAVSRFDIEMLMWAGYPNVITLLLIPLTFWLYLEKDRFSKVPFFVSTSILAGSIFLTHSLSSGMFILISAAVVLFILIWPDRMGVSRRTTLYWILPIIFGAVLVSPFLIQAIPTYIAEYSSGGTASILGYDIVIPLFALIAGILVFSKNKYRKFLALPSFLVAMWVFVPLIFTQGWLLGLAVDYNRFLYFLVLPVMIFIALLIAHSSDFFAQTLDKYLASKKPSISLKLPRKKLYTIIVTCILIFSFAALPIFSSAIQLNGGQTLQNYYQTMDNKGWDGIQWLKENTPEGSVLVSNALYGWWLGGYTQRPTLSAVAPEFLTVKREVDNASFARNLLDTDYIVGNNLIQVREDGGYLGRHNPEFLVKTRENYTYPFFNYDNDDIKVTLIVRLSDGSNRTEIHAVSSLPVTDMHRENTTDSESIYVTHGNDLFNFTQISTVTLGSQFAKMTNMISTDNPNVTLVTIAFGLDTKGYSVISDDYSYVAFVDEGMKSIGEIVFPEQLSRPITVVDESPVKITFGLNQERSVQLSYFMGVYQYSDEQLSRIRSGALTFTEIVEEKSHNYTSLFGDSFFTVFDYREELINRKVDYVVLQIDNNPIPEKTQIGVDPKFRCDPLFSLVFINEEVAIYRVNGNLK